MRGDVVEIARDLLGKVLCTRIDGLVCKAVITETEAYAGVDDKASHAHGGRRTKRTEPLYCAGGIAYVYLCYGIHDLFNVVTNIVDVPHAVLVRGGVPFAGVEPMLARRRKSVVDASMSNVQVKVQCRRYMAGPGTVAQALGITTALTATKLDGDTVWIEDQRIVVSSNNIVVGPRVGIDYAGEDKGRPYRFKVPQDVLPDTLPS